LVGPSMEYHRPIGLRWQVDVRGSALVPIVRDVDGVEVASNLTVAAIVADRWLAVASVEQTRTLEQRGSDHRPLADEWRVQYGASLPSSLEDRLLLQLKASGGQDHLQASVFSPNTPRRQIDVTLGLTYRFTGQVTAPGIASPLRTPAP